MENDYWRDSREREEYYNNYASKYSYVLKECKRCGQRVDMRTDHGICDSCADAAERGWEYCPQPRLLREKSEKKRKNRLTSPPKCVILYT